MKTTIAATTACFSCFTFAQKAGDDIIGVGIAFIKPKTAVGVIDSNSPQFKAALSGTTGTISDESTLSISWLHMFTDNFGTEFTIGLPPEHTLDLVTPATNASHPGAATITTWTPAAVAKYFFAIPKDKIRPYVGLGASRVAFHSPTINQNDASLRAIAGTSVDMRSEWVPVYNAGVIYNLDERWSVNASVSYLPITTTATFVGSGATSTGGVKINTTDYVIRMGYRF